MGKDGRAIRIHPLVRDFSIKTVPEHQQIKFRSYAAENLKTAYFDFIRLENELKDRGIADVLDDIQIAVDWWRRGTSGLQELMLLKNTLRLSDYALIRDPNQLSTQLIDRLKNEQHHDIVKLLDDAAECHDQPWLNPIWSFLTPPGPLLRSLKGHKGEITALGVDTNVKYIISSSKDKTLKVWEANSGILVKTLTGHTGPINDLAITPDARYVISASDDHTLMVWDLHKLNYYLTLKGHTHSVQAITISSCGRYAVSAESYSKDGNVKVWDLDLFKEIRTLSIQKGFVRGLVFDLSAQQVISASGQDIKKWNISDGKMVWGNSVWGPTDKDRKQLLQDGKIHYEDLDGDIKAMAILPDRNFLATGSGPDYDVGYAGIDFWDLNNGKKAEYPFGHSDSTNALTVSHDNRFLISGGGSIENFSENIIKLWDIEKKKKVASTPHHAAPVTALASIPNQLRFISGYMDGIIKVWDIERLINQTDSHSIIGHIGSAVNSVKITADARTVVSASDDHLIKIWSIPQRKEVNRAPSQNDKVHEIEFLPGEKQFLSVGWDMTLRRYDLISAEELMNLRCLDAECGYAVAVAPNNSFCATGSCTDNEIVIWDLLKEKEKHILGGHTSHVKALLITSDSRKVVSGSDDHTIKMWDIHSGEELRTLAMHQGPVTSLAISPDEKHLISASLDGSIIIWNLENEKETRKLTQLPCGINALVMSPDGQYVIIGDNDHILQVIEFATGKVITSLYGESPILSCDMAEDGRTIVLSDKSGRIGVVRYENF
jgi:WD40 repeat protein